MQHLHGDARRRGDPAVETGSRHRHPPRLAHRRPHRRRAQRPRRVLRQHARPAHRPDREPVLRRAAGPGPGDRPGRLRPPGPSLRAAGRGAQPEPVAGAPPAVPDADRLPEHRPGHGRGRPGRLPRSPGRAHRDRDDEFQVRPRVLLRRRQGRQRHPRLPVRSGVQLRRLRPGDGGRIHRGPAPRAGADRRPTRRTRRRRRDPGRRTAHPHADDVERHRRPPARRLAAAGVRGTRAADTRRRGGHVRRRAAHLRPRARTVRPARPRPRRARRGSRVAGGRGDGPRRARAGRPAGRPQGGRLLRTGPPLRSRRADPARGRRRVGRTGRRGRRVRRRRSGVGRAGPRTGPGPAPGAGRRRRGDGSRHPGRSRTVRRPARLRDVHVGVLRHTEGRRGHAPGRPGPGPGPPVGDRPGPGARPLADGLRRLDLRDVGPPAPRRTGRVRASRRRGRGGAGRGGRPARGDRTVADRRPLPRGGGGTADGTDRRATGVDRRRRGVAGSGGTSTGRLPGNHRGQRIRSHGDHHLRPQPRDRRRPSAGSERAHRAPAGEHGRVRPRRPAAAGSARRGR